MFWLEQFLAKEGFRLGIFTTDEYGYKINKTDIETDTYRVKIFKISEI